MIESLIPYNSNLIPIINKSFSIQLPIKSDILVTPEDKLTLKDPIASYESSPILESFDLDFDAWDFKVLHGELVKIGDILAKKRGLFKREGNTLISGTYGIIDLSINGKLFIREDYKDKFIPAGFAAEISTVDRLNFRVEVSLSGAGISPLFVHNLPISLSYLVGKDDSEIKILFHKENTLFDLQTEKTFDKLTIVDYLSKDEFAWVVSNLDRFTKGLCVLTSKTNKPRIELIHKLFEKINGNRLFVERGVLFSTLWKSRLKSYKYAKVRKGSVVIINHFNKAPISGKIISFKGLYILVETEDKKQRYTHYLNVFKK